jgi:hypothetical protein
VHLEDDGIIMHTIDEAADKDDRTVRERLGGRVPSMLLDRQDGRIIEPLTLRTPRRGVACAWVDDTDALGAIVIL